MARKRGHGNPHDELKRLAGRFRRGVLLAGRKHRSPWYKEMLGQRAYGMRSTRIKRLQPEIIMYEGVKERLHDNLKRMLTRLKKGQIPFHTMLRVEADFYRLEAALLERCIELHASGGSKAEMKRYKAGLGEAKKELADLEEMTHIVGKLEEIDSRVKNRKGRQKGVYTRQDNEAEARLIERGLELVDRKRRSELDESLGEERPSRGFLGTHLSWRRSMLQIRRRKKGE